MHISALASYFNYMPLGVYLIGFALSGPLALLAWYLAAQCDPFEEPKEGQPGILYAVGSSNGSLSVTFGATLLRGFGRLNVGKFG